MNESPVSMMMRDENDDRVHGDGRRVRVRVVVSCAALLILWSGWCEQAGTGISAAHAQEAPDTSVSSPDDAVNSEGPVSGPAQSGGPGPQDGQGSTSGGAIGSSSQGCVELSHEAKGDPGEAISPFSRGVSLEQQREAVELYCKGNGRYLRARYREAESLYQRAIELWSHPLFHHNLSKAKLRLVREPQDIYETSRKATEYGPEYLGEEIYREAMDSQETIKREIAWVVILCDEPETRVVFDGRVLPARDAEGRPQHRWEFAKRPGDYRVRAEKVKRDPGTEWVPDIQELTAVQAEETVVTLVPRQRFVERPRPPVFLWTTVGLGVASLVAGGVSYRKADRKFRDYDVRFALEGACPEGCQEGTGAHSTLQPRKDSAERWRLGAGIGIGLGAALLVTGTALLMVNGEQVRYSPALSMTDSATAQIMPVVGTDGQVGVTAAVRF